MMEKKSDPGSEHRWLIKAFFNTVMILIPKKERPPYQLDTKPEYVFFEKI